MNVPEWVARAKRVEAATVDVGFLVSDSFYFGPDYDISSELWRTLREPLYRPAVELCRSCALTRALVDSPGEMITYYRDVLRLCDKHGKQWSHQPSYFWLRPLLYSPGQFDISFPWYDTWDETRPVLDVLERGGEGEIFSDLEQGWEVTMFAADGRLFIRQGDFDSGEELKCVSCDHAALAGQVGPVRSRCERLLNEMRAALGFDYWRRR